MDEFEGRVAVVTGAASGIGFALAERFAAMGMKIVLGDVEEPALERAEAKLTEAGAATLAVCADVSKWEDVAMLADSAFDTFGAVHVLCNNAGVAGSRIRAGGIWQRTLEDWQWILGVNLWGAIHGGHAFLPRMLERGEEGHIVNTASLAGLAAGSGIYGVSKHAVVAFSESLRDQLAAMRAKIGVSALCPGVVSTNILDAERNRPGAYWRPLGPTEMSDDERAEEERARKRLAAGMQPAEVADAVVDGIVAQRFFIVPVQAELKPRIEQGIRRRAESMISALDP